jgi:S1-C subfamily serine protease
METLEKMIPHLTKDEASKRVALVTIRTLARPELATQMAQLYPSEGSVLALQQFASSSNPGERKQAVNALSGIAISRVEQAEASALGALGLIFDNFKSAVVRIRSVLSDSGQEHSVLSGIVVTNEGHILTAEYVVALGVGNDRSYTYSVDMWDGSTKTAILLDVNSADNLAVLKIEDDNYRILNLAANIPSSNTRVVTIGAILGGPIKAAVGTIRTVTDQFLEIEFDTPGGMAGIGGGPVLNASGEVVGISYSFEPPLRKCIRSDIAKKYLQSKGIRV